MTEGIFFLLNSYIKDNPFNMTKISRVENKCVITFYNSLNGSTFDLELEIG